MLARVLSRARSHTPGVAASAATAAAATVVASQLRGAQRTWRLAHPLGEEAQLARLHLDQETPHWRDRRAHRVWRRLRAIEVEALPGASELHAVLDAKCSSKQSSKL